MLSYIYVLQLKEGKYYVGKTNSVLRRCQDHMLGGGSAWTKKYPVEDLIECFEQKSQFDEDNKVKELMMKYGFSNVRGGSYSKIELTQAEKELLKKESSGANNTCFECGGNHFIKDCPTNKQKCFTETPVRAVPKEKAAKIIAEPVHPLLVGAVEVINVLAGATICSRCGRDNHTADKCYAKTNKKGEYIDEPSKIWHESENIQFTSPIIRATYGPENTNNDVTTRIQELQKKGLNIIRGGVNGVLGDPYPGKPKFLKVWY
jgi:predicted GIY-YIG superfamily endonuclease